MTDRELMQQAVEAMEYADACLKKQLTTKTKHEYAQDLLMEAGKALRERLAQEPNMPEQYVMVGRFMLQPHPQNGYWLTDTGTSEAMQIFQPEMEQVIKKLWSQF